MHRHEPRAALGDDREHAIVAQAGRDVVDDDRPGIQCRDRHRGLGRVDAHRNCGRGDERAHDPDDAAQLLGGVHRRRAGSGRLAADVEHRRTRGGERDAVLDRKVGVEEAAAVGERVRRDVHHAHHRARLGKDPTAKGAVTGAG